MDWFGFCLVLSGELNVLQVHGHRLPHLLFLICNVFELYNAINITNVLLTRY
jgi:hypothetical protein